MHYVHALVLFDSSASRSFLSSSFCYGFSIARVALSRLLRVSIHDERPVSATDIYQGCVLDTFGVGFPRDLIPIVMGYVCVFVGMDWLRRFGALIGYERKMVMV